MGLATRVRPSKGKSPLEEVLSHIHVSLHEWSGTWRAVWTKPGTAKVRSFRFLPSSDEARRKEWATAKSRELGRELDGRRRRGLNYYS